MSARDRLQALSDSQYRTARVEINGRTARVRVPRNATPEQAVEMALSVIPSNESKPTSFWQGVIEGAEKPIRNAARLAVQANPLASGLDFIGMGPRALDAKLGNAVNRAKDASPYQGSTAGRILGGVAATLPTAIIPGGPIAQGAASGLLMTDNLDDPKAVARDVAIGGAFGKAGDLIGKGVGRGVARAVGGRKATAGLLAPAKSAKQQAYREAVETLSQNDVLMTPGARAGGFARKLEDATDTIGAFTQFTPMGAAKERSLIDFNRAAYNEVVKPLGITLGKRVTPGREAISQLDDAVNFAYQKAVAPLRLRVDDELVKKIGSYADDALARMGPDDAAQLDANIAGIINWRQRPETLTGGEVSKTLQDMRKVASSARAANKHELADTLWNMHDDIEEAIMSQSPKGAVGPFRKAREAVRRMHILDKAGAKSNDGIVTPGQFKTAVHGKGYGVTDKRLARGNAPMQDLADAASLVLPDKLGNSGTAERAGLLSLLTGGGLFGAGSMAGLPAPAAALLGAGSLAYTPGVNRALQYGRNLPQARVAAGRAVSEIEPYVRRGAAGLLTGAGLYPFINN